MNYRSRTLLVFASGQLCLFLIVVLTILLSASVALAQTTGFTYQGRLTDGGTPANGNYDLQFALWDSSSGGTQIGSTQTVSTVAVSSGVFTVQLDFGANAFSGASRFLEISSRLSGAGSFTLLSPRQQITSTPYAVRSLNASSADAVVVTGVPAGSGNYIQNTTSQQSSNFNISGDGTAGGTLSGNVVNATTQYNLNGNRAFAVNGAGTGSKLTSNTFAGVGAGASTTPSATTNEGNFNSFFGATAGTLNTTGRANSFFGATAGQKNTTGNFNSFFGISAGNFNTTGGDNSFFGEDAGFANSTGGSNSFLGSGAGGSNTTGGNNSFFGAGAGNNNITTESNITLLGALSRGAAGITNATAVGSFAKVTQSNSLVLGSINGVNGANADTNVGIGTTAPLGRLDVRGDIFLGLSAAPNFPAPGTSNSLFVANDGGDIKTSLRIDGAGNNLYLIARSDIGATSGAGIIFRTAPAGGGPNEAGELDRVSINPDGKLAINVLGAAGATQLCQNAANQVATCSSSLRYKKDVTRFAGGLNVVSRLHPITFRWKTDQTLDVGLGAEDVAAVEPLLVTHNASGQVEGVKYDRMSAVFINAFKEQQAQIARQQKQIATLLTSNAALNARLRGVEKSLRKKAGSARQRR